MCAHFIFALPIQRYSRTDHGPDWSKPVKGVELYNHSADADENINIAADPLLTVEVSRLRKLLRAGWRNVLFPDLPPAPPPAPPVCSLHLYSGTAIGANHFSAFSAVDVVKCCAACSNEPKCASFVHNNISAMCYLMPNSTGARRGSQFTSGCRVRNCTSMN